MDLSVPQLLLQIGIAVLLGGTLAYLFIKQRKEAKKAQAQPQAVAPPEKPQHSLSIQLQAYERLILLSERIALPSLINRVNQPGLSVKEMQAVLIQNIRQEFDYNVTQQIYVSNESWEAVRNLKDQNILIINQVASFMPAEATGNDLNKSILEMLIQSPKASLHNVVSEVLSYEAKKLMQ